MRLVLILVFTLLPAFGETFTYWIEPCEKAGEDCEAADVEIAEWAMQAWEKASQGALRFEPSPLSKARIRLYWAREGSQGLYGEARTIEVDGKTGAEVHIRPDLHALGHKVEGIGSRDRLFRHTIVYLTCLHETGHALGLPHTRSTNDIMYSFEYGGNILEYFGRYRRKLRIKEDIRKYSGLSQDDQRKLLTAYGNGPKPTPEAGGVAAQVDGKAKVAESAPVR